MISRCYIAYLPNAGENDSMMVVKIGKSQNPSIRFQQLCAMGWITPGWMEATKLYDGAPLIDGLEIERHMHAMLVKDRIHHEWFHVSTMNLERVKQDVMMRFSVHWETVNDWEEGQ